MSRQGSGAKAKFALYREILRNDRAGKPGGFFKSLRRICDDPFSATSFQRTILGRPSMRFQGKGGIYRSDVGQTKTKSWGGDRSPPVGPPPGPGKRTRREDHALLIVRDEFRAGYSLIGLLASRARRRFTGTARINSGRREENRLSSNGNCVFSLVSHRRGSPHLSVFIGVHLWPLS